MTEERDPVRWADAASDCDPVLRRVLDTAREGLGDAARADALALDIERAVRARGLGSLRARGLRRWLSGMGIVGVIAGLGGAAWSLWSVPSAPDARTGAGTAASATPEAHVVAGGSAEHSAAADARAPTAGPAPVADLRAAPSAGHASAPISATTRVDRPAAARARSRPRAAQPEPRSGTPAVPNPVNPVAGATSAAGVAPAQTDVPPELQLLSEAQRALRAAPAEALALADLHARAYPSGRFVQEREEIAITALFALDERAAGRARARAFLARYPRSLSASRIATLLEDEH